MEENEPLFMHPNLKSPFCEAFLYLLENQAAASQVIQYVFKRKKKWGSRDRRFFAEAFYEILRHLGLYSKMLGVDYIHDPSSLTIEKTESLLEAYLENPKPKVLNVEDLYSTVHQDLLSTLKSSFDTEGVLAFLEESQKKADVFLRVNFLKTNLEDCQKALKDEGVETEQSGPFTLKLPQRKNVFTTKAFKDGFFEVQDISSQDVAPFLKPSAGDRVADLCAGAGGKTLHMASLMENKGSILAMDVEDYRLKDLKKRAKRAGVSNVQILPISSKALKRRKAGFDKVLLDAPCSGSGTYRRKPEAKIFFRKERLAELKAIQATLLDSYSSLVKPGGVLVYATCSLLKCENEEAVQGFLEKNQGFVFEESKTHFVGENGGDGFYMAKMAKKD